MYKSLKRIVLLLALVCVALGLSVFAVACNPEPEQPKGDGPEISDEYKALYEEYKAAAAESAKTLQDWYDALSADIEEIGDMGDITDMDVLEIENVKYVSLTYENGRFFLEELLNGESFKEYSIFTLSPTAADETTISGIYLEVNRKGADGALEKVRSARTGADGKANVYLEVGQMTYAITVGAQSADSYGFALGYEPEFSGSQATKAVTFSVQAASQKVTYAAKVVYKAEDNAPTKDVKLSLRYVESDPASLKVVGEGTTGDDGKVEISFYAHEGSNYEFVLDETSLTPEKYDPVEGPIEVDPEEEETLFTLIKLKNYDTPVSLTVEGTPETEDPELHNDCDIEVVAIPTSGEVANLLKLDANTHTYKYSNKVVYVALDYFLERVHAEKTIKQLLEDGGFFTFEKCVDENQNKYVKYDCSELLNAYMEHLTNGIYPLNEDLYKFIEFAITNELFADKTTEGKYDMFIPLVTYSTPKLIVGKEFSQSIKESWSWDQWADNSKGNAQYVTIPVKSDVPEGYYKLHIHSPKDITDGQNGEYARFGGFTRDKYGDCYIGRNFALNKVATTGDSGYDCEGVVYIGANVKEIVLFNGTSASGMGRNYATLKMTLSKITAEDGTVVNDDVSALADKKQEILTPDKGEYEVLVYPETSIWEQHTNASNKNEKQYLKNFTNISTYGYSFGLNRLGVKYTVTPTEVGDLTSLKIHKYYIQNSNSDKATAGSGKGIPIVTYTAGTAISGSTTNLVVTTGDRTKSDEPNGQFTWGVLFTHSGTGIKTMKIKVEATNTKYTVTYSAGEGVGEDYIEGGSLYTSTKYYTKGTQNVTVLDNTNTNLKYTREGYEFDGWSYQNDEGGTVIVEAGNKIDMPDHDLVLTAIWREV